MKCILHPLKSCAVLIFLALQGLVPHLAFADDWASEQGISFWCGGVGDESREQMKGAESTANARLLLTAGAERSYLSDVSVSITSADKRRSATWKASGPICLLKLPQGNYSVDASYRDEHHSAPLSIKAGKASGPQQLVFTFKPS